MRLLLENIKQHESLECDLPNNGVVLLRGVSGAGKSTILKAICWALHGNMRNMATNGRKKHSVMIEGMDWIGLDIKRTGSPNTLTVKDKSGNEYKDASAQEVINQVLGMDETEFGACSYIEQDANKSFLSLGPADQLRFVGKLAETKYDVESIRKDINERISDSEKEINAASGIVAHMKSSLDSQKCNFENLKVKLVEPKSLHSDEEIRTLTEEHSELSSRLTVLNEEIRILNSGINDPIYKKMKSIESDRDALNEIKASGSAELSEIEEKFEAIPNSYGEMSRDQVKDKYKAISEKEKRLDCKDQIMSLAEAVYEKYPASRESQVTLTEFLYGKLSSLDAETQKFDKQYRNTESRKKELDGMKKPQHCPSCEIPLAVIEGKIEKAEHIPENIDEIREELVGALNDLAGTITVCDKERNEIRLIIAKADELKNGLAGSDPLPDIKNEESLQILKQELHDYEDQQVKHESSKCMLGGQREKLKKKISDCQKRLENTEEEIREAKEHGLKPLDDLIAAQQTKSGEVSEITKRLPEIRAVLDKNETYLRELAKYKSDKTHVENIAAEIEEGEILYKTRAGKLEDSHKKYAAACRLRELSDIAAVSSMEMIIEEINANASAHIDKMFADDGTVIRIKNFATTKKGEERAKFGTDIFHKGKQVSKLKDYFSGGEGSRSCLAFQLGLSDMYNSPLLMVDEGFTGLDPEGKDGCMGILKDVSDGKLIIVVEHGADDSFFDEVIDL